jgi:hypothetical protein
MLKQASKAQSKPDKQQCMLLWRELQQSTQKPVVTDKAGYSRARGEMIMQFSPY